MRSSSPPYASHAGPDPYVPLHPGCAMLASVHPFADLHVVCCAASLYQRCRRAWGAPKILFFPGSMGLRIPGPGRAVPPPTRAATELFGACVCVSLKFWTSLRPDYLRDVVQHMGRARVCHGFTPALENRVLTCLDFRLFALPPCKS